MGGSKKRKSWLVTIFTALLALWLAGFFLFSAASVWRMPAQIDQKTDAIVVLTGGSNRLEEGLMLFAAGKAKELFVSGVHPDVTENEVRAIWKGGAPVPECCITLDRQSISTLQNAIETSNWAKKKNIHSIRLVTANYHMNRALLHFSALMPGVKIIPHPIEQPGVTAETKRFWIITFGEYHKTLFRLVAAPVLYVQSIITGQKT